MILIQTPTQAHQHNNSETEQKSQSPYQEHQIQVYAFVMTPPSLSYQTKQPGSERDNKRQYTTYEVSKSHQLPETSCIQSP
jgi:hypothetical protein